jgi:hypothetical protein
MVNRYQLCVLQQQNWLVRAEHVAMSAHYQCWTVQAVMRRSGVSQMAPHPQALAGYLCRLAPCHRSSRRAARQWQQPQLCRQVGGHMVC